MAKAAKLTGFSLAVLLVLCLTASIYTAATAKEISISKSLWPLTYFDLDMTSPIIAGDDIQTVAVIENHNDIAGNITFITQIVNSDEIALAIQEFKTAINPNNETIKLINTWKTEKAGFYRVEAFLLAEENNSSNLPVYYPISDKWAAGTLVRPANLDNSHDLRLEIQIDNPENVAAGSLKGSVELVNYGNGSELIKIEPDGAIDVWPVGIQRSIPARGTDCDHWFGSELNDVDAFELPSQGKVKLNDGDTISIPYGFLDHADFYELSWNAKLRLQEPDGVRCMYVPSEKVRFNVTAPSYEGINLVLSSDKQSYDRNETVRFEAQIENTSDEPFQIREDEIIVHIRDNDGRNILWFSRGGSSEPSLFTVPAHTNYTLDHLSYPTRPWFWEWDQRNYSPEGTPIAIEPGQYLAYATFSYPPMKSETITITID